jgi:hypothetical protein
MLTRSAPLAIGQRSLVSESDLLSFLR